MRAAQLLVVLFWLFGSSGSAVAQSLTPMRGELVSTTDSFALRLFAGNPYHHRMRVEFRVYDADFAPVRADVRPAIRMLGGGGKAGVLVIVPFEGARERRVRVCVESIPFPQQTTRVRTQICGKFLARRVG
ncbi:MAG: hypothetical protein KDJ47_18675 [Hyphomicrobiaceae bacterium]|nr:hypothetical protein [Hyphomicrobiaceae bacterium]